MDSSTIPAYSKNRQEDDEKHEESSQLPFISHISSLNASIFLPATLSSLFNTHSSSSSSTTSSDSSSSQASWCEIISDPELDPNLIILRQTSKAKQHENQSDEDWELVENDFQLFPKLSKTPLSTKNRSEFLALGISSAAAASLFLLAPVPSSTLPFLTNFLFLYASDCLKLSAKGKSRDSFYNSKELQARLAKKDMKISLVSSLANTGTKFGLSLVLPNGQVASVGVNLISGAASAVSTKLYKRKNSEARVEVDMNSLKLEKGKKGKSSGKKKEIVVSAISGGASGVVCSVLPEYLMEEMSGLFENLK
eukprot:snap_masked-scaffold_48-processed-gene-1.64-mRNA-1 protein AED:1.00 eAED:1.00 QI:0/-1/0/0/-1/1/1/0/308